jgi:membrane protein YdbS with pleckstrin-like domain
MPDNKGAKDEEKLKPRYVRAARVVFFIAIIYSFWILFLIMSVYFLGFGNKWAGLSMNQWITVSIGFFSFLILVELLFVANMYRVKKRRLERERPKPLFFKGKRVHTVTLPLHCKGGIFSKTYIRIDDESILNLRFQMIPPHELWGKKE